MAEAVEGVDVLLATRADFNIYHHHLRMHAYKQPIVYLELQILYRNNT